VQGGVSAAVVGAALVGAAVRWTGDWPCGIRGRCRTPGRSPTAALCFSTLSSSPVSGDG